ncbi:MAG: hypothetical protein AAGI48_17105 [Verrucomicrobiota bacterium]
MKSTLVVSGFFGVLFSLASFGAQTAGWRVPLSHVLWQGLDSKGVKKMDQPPSVSAFFKTGDELWDLSSAIRWESNSPFSAKDDPFAVAPEGGGQVMKFEGEWVVWNATSQMIVARGAPKDLGLVDLIANLDKIPLMIRTRLDLLDASGRFTEGLSLISRSGEMASVKCGNLHLKIVGNIGSDRRLLDLDFEGLVRGRSLERVRTGVTLLNGKPLKLARWTEAGEGWEMRVAAELVTVDDQSASSLRWIEKDGALRMLDHVNSGLGVPGLRRMLDDLELPDGLSARVFSVPRDSLARLSGHEDEVPAFQYVEDVTPSLPGDLAVMSWVDARAQLQENGVRFDHQGSIAGFNAGRGLLFVINTPVQMDLVETIFLSTGPSIPTNLRLQLEGDGILAMLMSRSGEKVAITRGENDDLETLFEIAPNVGATYKLVDVRYRLKSETADIELESAATLSHGQAIQVAGAGTENGGKTLTLTGWVEREGE